MKLMIKRLLVAILFACSISSHARAQNCSFSVSSMNFGAIDTLVDNRITDTTATINIDCNGLRTDGPVFICLSLGSGSGGATAAARQMTAPKSKLNYQFYSDPDRRNVWGGRSWPYNSNPLRLLVNLDYWGRGRKTIRIYGRLHGGQSMAEPGRYVSVFSRNDIEFRYRYAFNNRSCNAYGKVVRPSFNVSATVPMNCRISTRDIDFGSQGVLDVNVDATGQVEVRCTPGNTYSIALSGGNAGASPAQRKMKKGAETITYGLYKDARRSQPWGENAETTVMARGDGNHQRFTVYGRVPVQHTPSPGIYTDTVIVTVTY